MSGGTPGCVTVFGSLHHDIMVDAPALPVLGETVAGQGWRSVSGGKGLNQAVAAARAGAKVAMVGVVGEDLIGDGLVAHLDRAGVDHSRIRRTAEARTGMSVAITESHGDYGAVIVSGANLLLGAKDVCDASAMLRETAVLVLQNEVPEAANVAAAKAARQAGAVVVLNAAPARPISDALASAIDILVVNAIEAEMMSRCEAIHSLDGALRAAQRLAGAFGTAIVTAGGLGLAFAGKHADEGTISAIPIEVVSTHGAGDTFVGTLAAEIAAGGEFRHALCQANRAAAALVGGTGHV